MSILAQWWPEEYWEHDWIAMSVDGSDMTRINMRWLYYLGSHIRGLAGFAKEGASARNQFFGLEMIWVREDMRRIARSEDLDLPLCKSVAEEIVRQIDLFFPPLPEFAKVGDSVRIEVDNRAMTTGEANLLSSTLQHFESLLLASIQEAHIFKLSDKGILSVPALVSGASRTYPAKVFSHLSATTRLDIDEAGRCLAFDRATACGFHILRAVESVMEQYIIKAQGTIPAIKTWHEYIVAIEHCGGSEKVLNLLRSMKDHYRNPLMHPEDVLTTETAIELFSLSQAAIVAMIQELIDRAFLSAPV
jgi:hypothetical protein